MKVLIIDNYDSFTYNLQHYLQQLTAEVQVIRNDEMRLEDCEEFSHLVLSPGPGLPVDAGITMAVIDRYYRRKPILGVCLGCQALGQHAGATLYNQPIVSHGIKRLMLTEAENSWLLKNLPASFRVGLYHSWAVDETSLPQDWRVVGWLENKVLMAMEHRQLPLAGVQFHPESIMSEQGLRLLKNWLDHGASSP